MACHQLLHCQIQSMWRTVFHLGSKLSNSHFRRLHPIYPLSTSLHKGYCRISEPIYAKNIDTDQVVRRDGLFDTPHTEIRSTNIDPSNGKLMLIDGTSIIYRAYYRLLVLILTTFTFNSEEIVIPSE
uniref:5'-3' exonuclease alpha-helical arch N-terminal domain-containing protein n=1 Tax=Solanum lycopersicum TaxID=4081 RepID=A0A3Q7FL09_SOLLC